MWNKYYIVNVLPYIKSSVWLHKMNKTAYAIQLISIKILKQNIFFSLQIFPLKF